MTSKIPDGYVHLTPFGLRMVYAEHALEHGQTWHVPLPNDAPPIVSHHGQHWRGAGEVTPPAQETGHD